MLKVVEEQARPEADRKLTKLTGIMRYNDDFPFSFGQLKWGL